VLDIGYSYQIQGVGQRKHRAAQIDLQVHDRDVWGLDESPDIIGS
jgi:hypothetical protein